MPMVAKYTRVGNESPSASAHRRTAAEDEADSHIRSARAVTTAPDWPNGRREGVPLCASRSRYITSSRLRGARDIPLAAAAWFDAHDEDVSADRRRCRAGSDSASSARTSRHRRGARARAPRLQDDKGLTGPERGRQRRHGRGPDRAGRTPDQSRRATRAARGRSQTARRAASRPRP